MLKVKTLKNNPTYKYVLKIYKGFKYFDLQLFSHLHINYTVYSLLKTRFVNTTFK